MRIKYIKEPDWPSSNLSQRHPTCRNWLAKGTLGPALLRLILFGWNTATVWLGVKYIKTGLNWVDVFVADLLKCRYQRSKGALVIAMFCMWYISKLSELSLSINEQMSPAQPKKMTQRQKNEPLNECKTDESPNTTHTNKQVPPPPWPTNNKTEFK